MTNTPTKVLIVDDIHPIFISKLQASGIGFEYQPDIGKEEALQIIAQYTGLVIRSKFKVDAAFMDAAPQLRFIARGGAGMDNIDDAYAQKKGITLLNAPEGNRDAVGEHMVGMLLALMNNLNRANLEVRQGLWRREENRGLELGGRTVALIGYGNNGQAMARKLSGFDVTVIAYDKYKTGFSDAYATEVSMEEVVKRADVLSLHIPLTRETRSMIDDEYLFHFRKPIFFLNGARGEIVHIPAILKALDEGRILGAAFDVLPVEKFPDLAKQPWFIPLTGHEKVVLSPHVAGWSVESYFKIADVLSEKIINYLSAV
ncbi:phosphoglycerate dehydrogenase [Parapedobacter sp. ISTM3]|uniref:D-3-phosphoglycerate dehydrogenase n=1 Tax=Parapedobacter luteus TaxID=623280 RepID=A0A1T5BW97_9SPHI|nr:MULTISPECIES: NAD(P)-dependent oxidoreductase [Parapedobacter]MBK1442338.1 phosphoglycerate dehydrogenase [Parapedobacter sp. ISTM3]SKB51263.1 D-3-phosphoglycerate dehydrogenase [Parapedobacter luteus]